MFGTVFILHIPQKCLLVLGSVAYFVLRINIRSLVPLCKRLQLLERIEGMCRNEKHPPCWSHFSVVFGQVLPSKLYSEEHVLLPLSLLFNQGSHYAIHMVEYRIVHCDNVMQYDCIYLRHPQRPILQWHQNFGDILHNGPFILRWDKWPVSRKLFILEPLMCEFP